MRYEIGNTGYVRSRMTRTRFILSKIKDQQQTGERAAEQRMANAQTPVEVLDAVMDQLRSTSRNRPIGSLLEAAGQRLLILDQQSGT